MSTNEDEGLADLLMEEGADPFRLRLARAYREVASWQDPTHERIRQAFDRLARTRRTDKEDEQQCPDKS
jgi:hypothetical protein